MLVALSRRLLSLLLPVLLSACAATAETQERCTPQWPPGPCAEAGKSR
jgi:hypothetical protein